MVVIRPSMVVIRPSMVVIRLSFVVLEHLQSEAAAPSASSLAGEAQCKDDARARLRRTRAL